MITGGLLTGFVEQEIKKPCGGCGKKGNKLQGVADALISPQLLDDLMPINSVTGQRAMNINIGIDLKDVILIVGAIIVGGYILKKI